MGLTYINIGSELICGLATLEVN